MILHENPLLYLNDFSSKFAQRKSWNNRIKWISPIPKDGYRFPIIDFPLNLNHLLPHSFIPCFCNMNEIQACMIPWTKSYAILFILLLPGMQLNMHMMLYLEYKYFCPQFIILLICKPIHNFNVVSCKIFKLLLFT